jgi:hypothetical protein
MAPWEAEKRPRTCEGAPCLLGELGLIAQALSQPFQAACYVRFGSVAVLRLRPLSTQSGYARTLLLLRYPNVRLYARVNAPTGIGFFFDPEGR